MFPKLHGNLLECAVIVERMWRGEIEPPRVPRNVLDVPCQQIVALYTVAPRTVAEIERLVGRALPYRKLSRAALEAVLGLLCGHYPAQDFAGLKPLLAWDRAQDLLSPRRGAALTVHARPGE